MAATTSGFWGSELVEVMFGYRYQAGARLTATGAEGIGR
jgi:hypothetical protein